jgi:hypothetical protein
VRHVKALKLALLGHTERIQKRKVEKSHAIETNIAQVMWKQKNQMGRRFCARYTNCEDQEVEEDGNE